MGEHEKCSRLLRYQNNAVKFMWLASKYVPRINRESEAHHCAFIKIADHQIIYVLA